MKIDIESQEHLVRVILRGPCTLCHAADLNRAFQPLAGNTTAVMVELDQITELDHEGLQVLLGLRKDCPTLFFCYANSLVQKTVEAFDLHITFHGDD